MWWTPLALAQDTGLVPTFDSAPDCVADVAPETGLIVDTGAPSEDPCDLDHVTVEVPRVWKVVAAEDVAMGRYVGDQPGDRCGWTVGALGDNDGDGLSELAVVCWEEASWYDPLWVPRVRIFEGAPVGDQRMDAAQTVVEGAWGATVERASLTGPGARDLLIYPGGGPTYLTGLPLPSGVVAIGDVAIAMLGQGSLGNSLDVGVSAGDYDGDGQDDLLVGGHPPTAGGGGGGQRLFLGPLVGEIDPWDDPNDPNDPTTDDGDAWFHLDGPLEGPWADTTSGAFSPAMVGDVDGDGTADVLMGAEEIDNLAGPPREEFGPAADSVQGGLALFTGGVLGDRTADDVTALLYGTCYGNYAGELDRHARVGDLTGDCVPDVASAGAQVEVNGVSVGAVQVLSALRRVRGHLPITRAAGATIVGVESVGVPYAWFGVLAPLGDVDHDGHADLAVGASFDGVGGRVYLFRGPLRGVVSAASADLILEGPANAHFGTRLRWGRDMDGDGTSDLLVGDPWDGVNDTGAVWVFSGADLAARMADTDLDGVDNVADNCFVSFNPDQADADADGGGDRCDCDDADPTRSPNFEEVAFDGIDNDCDGATPDRDGDGDGWAVAQDCDDGDQWVNPARPELQYDGVDNDCSAATRDDDLDGDGAALSLDCDDDDPTRASTLPETPYDGVDNDCSAATPDDDLDGDGAPGALDCDDGDPLAEPGGVEVPYDGSDNDCDVGTVDDDLDGDGALFAADCDDDDATVSPLRPEVPYDGVDNDCDPATLDDDADLDGSSVPDDCDDDDATVSPLRPEVPYDDVDNDCDPATLDDDADLDGSSVPDDCDDDDATVSPLRPEVPYDGVDNDCDPATPDDDLDHDGFVAAVDCDDATTSVYPGAAEVLGDGVDNDCDPASLDEPDTRPVPGRVPEGCGCASPGPSPLGIAGWVVVLAAWLGSALAPKIAFCRPSSAGAGGSRCEPSAIPGVPSVKRLFRSAPGRALTRAAIG